MTSAFRRRMLTVPATLAAGARVGPVGRRVDTCDRAARSGDGAAKVADHAAGLLPGVLTWLESAGVVMAGWLWVTGRGHNRRANLRLQRWWIERLVGADAPDHRRVHRGS